MVIVRLLAVGLLSASLSVSSAEAGGLPTSKVVVQAMHPKWPDGSWVESGGLNYPTDIYVVDANGKHVRNLTHDAPTNYLIGWLHHRQRILYESVPSDRMRAGRSGISSIKADGSRRRQLVSGKGELLPKLSRDGHRILFAHGRWVYVMHSDGTHKRPLVQTSFGYYDPPTYGPYDASWSPDGKRIAFVRGFAKEQAYGSGKNPRSVLYVVNADGTGLRRLTAVRPKVETMNPAWAPDGRKIVFVEHSYTDIETHDRAYVVRADGTHVQRLKQLDNAYEFWLPNGRIAYQSASGRLQSIDADGTGKPQALPSRMRVGGALWITSGRSAGRSWPVSPDGKWIALTTGQRSLWIAHLDGTHRRLVTRKICCFFSSFDFEWTGNHSAHSLSRPQRVVDTWSRT
jgi:Tol biopolymer transport system component